MSDSIKHECAVSMLRLRHNPEYYVRKYGTAFYGCRKISLLLEKQHNRGQDGAGIGCVRLDPAPGEPGYRLERSCKSSPLADILGTISDDIAHYGVTNTKAPFCGDLYLGHLRYGTFGRKSIDFCHPFLRESACLNRTVMLAGNFNLTNTQSIMESLIETGHHPSNSADGYLLLQYLGHCLERDLTRKNTPLDFADVLERTLEGVDGAYTLCGVSGDGISFAIRDPAGIRPGYFYFDDEVVVVSSERPAIQTAFNCVSSEVMELPPGEALIVGRDGKLAFHRCLPQKPLRRCVFERIYFSRPNDADIYKERNALGGALVPQIMEEVEENFDDTFFSYIPNSALVGFYGMLESLNRRAFELGKQVRFGQIALKDAKFRTFITDTSSRKELGMHVYDVTYGLVRPATDTLVVLDDSIVRGNTMRNTILPMLSRLSPRKIVVVSTAPPIKYPDCYGIDMASLNQLVAFEAAIDLLRENDKMWILDECGKRAAQELEGPLEEMTNCVAPIYDEFSEEELSDAISRRLIPEGDMPEIKIIFQTCKNLAKSCPEHTGDWYFTGKYPTFGGFRVVNQALLNYINNVDTRAY